jgi:formylglycine-generating enzyme
MAALTAWIAVAACACREVQGAAPVPSAAALAPPTGTASAPAIAAPTAVASVEAPVDAGASSLATDGGADGREDGGADGGEDAGADGGAPQRCPRGMALVGHFCIDRYEAHLVSGAAGGELTLWPHHQRPEQEMRYEARSQLDAFPQAYISRVEAKAACSNAGKRLCSMQEWQRACEGRQGTNYPYGPSWQAKRCNTDKGHLPSIRFGKDASRWTYEDFNNPELAQEPGFLAQSGAYAECVGDSGVHDLVGNLHEWVSDTVDDALVDKLETEDVGRKTQHWRLGNGVFMGGFFSNHEELGPGCKYTTIAHEPTYHDYSTGFRCCATPSKPPGKARK